MGWYPYSSAEMARHYPPTARIAFGGRYALLTGEQALRLDCRLVNFDRTTGTYQRVQLDPASELEIISTANHRAQLNLEPRRQSNGNRIERR